MKGIRRLGPWLLSGAVHAALGAAAWVTVVGMPESGGTARGLSPDTDATYEVTIQPGGAPRIGEAGRDSDGKYGAPQDTVVIDNAAPDAVPDLPNTIVAGPRLVASAPPGTGLPARTYSQGPVATFPSQRGGGGGPAPGPVAASGASGTGAGTGKGVGEGKDEGVEAVPLDTPPPAYPDAARRSNVEGVVIAELRIDKQGRVESARAAQGSGSALLDDAALAAVRAWRYRPATLAGAPVPSVRRVRFEFRLE
jgi:TonB family protein